MRAEWRLDSWLVHPTEPIAQALPQMKESPWDFRRDIERGRVEHGPYLVAFNIITSEPADVRREDACLMGTRFIACDESGNVVEEAWIRDFGMRGQRRWNHFVGGVEYQHQGVMMPLPESRSLRILSEDLRGPTLFNLLIRMGMPGQMPTTYNYKRTR